MPIRLRFRRLVAGTILAATAVLTVGLGRGAACDLCAVYTATDLSERRFNLGVAQQFTRFATLQDNGEEVDNPAGERMESAITQLYAGARVVPWLGVQLNLPVIYRSFRRLTIDGIDNGDESGIGDMTLFASFDPRVYIEGETIVLVSGLFGIKLPTGNADRLSEELAEEEEVVDPTDDPWFPRGGRQPTAGDGGGAQHVPGEVPTGVHGHDLALGSGSTDVFIGARAFASWRRFFATAGLQYLIRTEGSFDYQYANDLLWFAGPGYFALLHDDYTLGVQAMVFGESKGNDTVDGERLDDTAMTSVYMGPALRATWKDRLSADIVLDLPLLQNNSSLQLVPDYRIRGGLTWRF